MPMPNKVPEGGLHTAVTSRHGPSTRGEKLTTAPHWFRSLGTVTGEGHWMVGAGDWKLGVSGRSKVSPSMNTWLKVAVYSRVWAWFRANQRMLVNQVSWG